MHFYCEIIIPKVDDVMETVEQILKPFDENPDEDTDTGHSFWDWWEIGGRFSGNKMKNKLNKEQLKKFYEKLKELKITVSGLIFGKEELNPSNQIQIVDDLWKEYFPNSEFKNCPLFKHSNKESNILPGDIMPFGDVPLDLEMSRIIFCASPYGNDIKAIFMLEDSMWNGVNHVETKWNGKFSEAIKLFNKHIQNYKDEYREIVTPKDDWLVVTIDYHS